MNKRSNENFYKSICNKYINTMSKEVLLETNNKVLHIFIEDEYIELKENGKINIQNYKEYLDGDFNVDEYDSYKDLYNSIIKDEVINDIDDLGLFNDNNNWNFYITFEELKEMGYAHKVKYNYPLIEKYIIDDETDFYAYFSLEQLKDFEESLHLYYETDDIDTNQWGELYSKSNTSFNHNIISLSEGMIEYNDFISDYLISNYDLLLDNVIAYFSENQIKNLMDYGSDKDEGLTSISSLYKELMDKLNVKYANVYTEDVSDGKYLTTITFENDSEIKIDTSAWNGIKVVAENIESICENHKSLKTKLKDNISKNEMENDISYC